MTGDGRGYEIVTVRDGPNGLDLGISTESEPPEIRGVGDHGVGTDLEVPAYDEIRAAVDLEELEPGTEIARVEYDLDSWTYEVEYLVATGWRDRLEDLVREVAASPAPPGMILVALLLVWFLPLPGAAIGYLIGTLGVILIGLEGVLRKNDE